MMRHPLITCIWMSALSVLIVALLLDKWLGEPAKFHPLAGFGWWVEWIESKLRPAGRSSRRAQMASGVAATIVTVLPLTLLGAAVDVLSHGALLWCLSVMLVYLAIGHASLHAHALAVSKAVERDDWGAARAATARLVSRDTEAFDATQLSGATIESVLENGNDAVLGVLFWFAIGGIPGAILYRLSNTLDAMWGYKTDRYLYFGRAAARLDDLLNWIPARLTAASYALLGDFPQAVRCWREQGNIWKSPNAGPVMAAGAGALNIVVGGDAYYHGTLQQRPRLGGGGDPAARDIHRALRLVEKAIFLWLAVIALIVFVGSR